MPTTTVGLFFVRQGRASNPAVSTHRSDDGQFVLQMRLLDHQGPHKEGYVVRWIGEDARAFHAAHPDLKAGDALSLDLLNPRSLPGLQSPEIHATVRGCRLMPARVPAAMTAASARG
jgi:hypothetical protein